VLRLITRRLLAAVPIMLIVSFATFALADLAPGDPAQQIAGETAPPEVVEAIRQDLQLDDPLVVRYVRWLGNAVQGDFGVSFVYDRDVSELIAEKLPITASLGLLSLMMSLTIGLVFGVLAALRPRGLLDRAIVIVSSFLVAVPSFWLALMLVVVFSVENNWLPAVGYVPFTEDPWEWFRHLILPATAVGMLASAETTLQLRASLIDTTERDFILAARARGLRRRSIMLRHALKTGSIPIATILGFRLAFLIGGTVIIERIFAINGMGTLVIGASQGGDVNLMLGIVVLITTAVVLMNALVDITYGWLNPRLRVQ
jgi:peptide/nickel transport system permease protein